MPSPDRSHKGHLIGGADGISVSNVGAARQQDGLGPLNESDRRHRRRRTFYSVTPIASVRSPLR